MAFTTPLLLSHQGDLEKAKEASVQRGPSAGGTRNREAYLVSRPEDSGRCRHKLLSVIRVGAARLTGRGGAGDRA